MNHEMEYIGVYLIIIIIVVVENKYKYFYGLNHKDILYH